jgi:hypothetical protein
MEAFVVVLLAVAVLGVGVVALLVLLRMRRLTDPTYTTNDRER